MRLLLAITFVFMMVVVEGLPLYYDDQLLTDSNCPPVAPPCTCEGPTEKEPYVHMTCKGAPSLDHVVQAIGPAMDVVIGRLTIVDTPISEVSEGAFDDYAILQLELVDCQVTRLHAHAFEGKMKDALRELILEGNQLREVPSAALKPLPNLTRLSLARNQLLSVKRTAFVDWASVQTLNRLDLGANQLTDFAIHKAAFAPLKRLRQLSIAGNRISNVIGLAKKLPQQRDTLEYLNMANNGIAAVARELPFKRLVSLSLEDNHISYIHPRAFRKTRRLLYLFLAGNRFARWPLTTFEFCNKLRILSIGGNQLTEIDESSFHFTPNLRRLEMSRGNLRTVKSNTFRKLEKIQSVILDHNQLTRMPQNVFTNHAHLYTVDLSYNMLNTMPSGAFQGTPSLRHVDLRNNMLKTMRKDVFDSDFRAVDGIFRSVLLCGNPWDCEDTEVTLLREWVRQVDNIVVDTPTCIASCIADGTPLVENGTQVHPNTTHAPVDWTVSPTTTAATVPVTATSTATTTSTTTRPTTTTATTTTSAPTTSTQATVPSTPSVTTTRRPFFTRNAINRVTPPFYVTIESAWKPSLPSTLPPFPLEPLTLYPRTPQPETSAPPLYIVQGSKGPVVFPTATAHLTARPLPNRGIIEHMRTSVRPTLFPVRPTELITSGGRWTYPWGPNDKFSPRTTLRTTRRPFSPRTTRGHVTITRETFGTTRPSSSTTLAKPRTPSTTVTRTTATRASKRSSPSAPTTRHTVTRATSGTPTTGHTVTRPTNRPSPTKTSPIFSVTRTELFTQQLASLRHGIAHAMERLAKMALTFFRNQRATNVQQRRTSFPYNSR